MEEGISDHTPLKLTFPQRPRAKATFKYYDMWGKDSRIHDIVADAMKHSPPGIKMYQLFEVLK